MRVAHVWAGVVIVVAGGLLASMSAQLPPPARMPRPGTTATKSATQVISPVALVTWVAQYGSDGVGHTQSEAKRFFADATARAAWQQEPLGARAATGQDTGRSDLS